MSRFVNREICRIWKNHGSISLSRPKSQCLEKKELLVKEEDGYAMSQLDKTEKR